MDLKRFHSLLVLSATLLFSCSGSSSNTDQANTSDTTNATAANSAPGSATSDTFIETEVIPAVKANYKSFLTALYANSEYDINVKTTPDVDSLSKAYFKKASMEGVLNAVEVMINGSQAGLLLNSLYIDGNAKRFQTYAVVYQSSDCDEWCKITSYEIKMLKLNNVSKPYLCVYYDPSGGGTAAADNTYLRVYDVFDKACAELLFDAVYTKAIDFKDLKSSAAKVNQDNLANAGKVSPLIGDWSASACMDKPDIAPEADAAACSVLFRNHGNYSFGVAAGYNATGIYFMKQDVLYMYETVRSTSSPDSDEPVIMESPTTLYQCRIKKSSSSLLCFESIGQGQQGFPGGCYCN
ncbi:hypothetical protein WSM22_06470 [Cytophagales bacterium WSM2-2]|nr:hypothetical protein WSM22_06470 [Cytophagales bacterium WSM2-2]